MNLDGRVCAVTGAGRGIGRQITIDFVRKGAKVYIVTGTKRLSLSSGKKV
jgi:NAD(P)-dependent dehydrogenase (short-subunit alcohol dehydrogenase family)